MHGIKVVTRVAIAAALIVAAIAWGLNTSLLAQSASLVPSLAPGNDAGPAPLASRLVGAMALANLPVSVSAAAEAPQISDAKADALARMMRRITMAQRRAAAERIRAAKGELAKRAGTPGLLGAIGAPKTSQASYVGIPGRPELGLIPDYFGTDSNWANSPLLAEVRQPPAGA